jgi:hypothetical protein
MLELRPSCEHCNKALPPASLEARICSYECTFCAACVEEVLGNVCPNCAGGFTARPIRPTRNWKGDNHLGKNPAATRGETPAGRSDASPRLRRRDREPIAGAAIRLQGVDS